MEARAVMVDAVETGAAAAMELMAKMESLDKMEVRIHSFSHEQENKTALRPISFPYFCTTSFI
jgi:hypothetical protein